LGGAEILNSQESLSDFEIISGKKGNQVNVFVVNGESPKSNVAFQIDNLPWSSATVNVFDNFQGNTPIDSFPISGNSFTYNIPGYSSLLFSIESSSCTGTCKTNSCDTYDNCVNGSGTCTTGYCCSGACTTCGDGNCDPGENCSSCPDDCGCVSPQICCNGLCTTPACFNESDCGTDPCKVYTCNNPGNCSASCSSQDITSCINDDSCCPTGCTEENDNDCGGLGPVALYHFDEGIGTNVADSSGNGNDGTVYGAAWTTGISGNALEFDGSDYINVPDSSSLNNPSAVTVEAWVKLDSYMSAQDMCSAVQKYVWSTPGRGGFSLGTANMAGGYSDDGLPAFIIVEDENYDAAVSSAQLSLDTWYHLVGTYDETTNTVRIYVDGEEKDATSFAGELYSAGVSLEIGRDLPLSRWFDGTVDEVRIYNRALSPEEILEHYNKVKADLNNDGVVDIEDLIIVAIDFGKTSGFDPIADVVQNGEIDIFDVVFVASRLS